MLGDITCDSDGKIDQFIDRRDVKRTLPLHTVNGEPYYLGVFLVGAYQEILGDLHNLFGDTHAVHVSLDDRGSVVLDAVIKGDTVKEVLDYVEFDADTLVRKLRTRRRARRARGQDQLRGVRPAAAVLRRRAAGLHLPGRAQGKIADVRSRDPAPGSRRSRPVSYCGSCDAELVERLRQFAAIISASGSRSGCRSIMIEQLAVAQQADRGRRRRVAA